MIHDILAQYENRAEADNIKTTTLTTINKHFRNWAKSYPDLQIDPKKTMSLLRKQSSINECSDEVQAMYMECLSRDIVQLLKSCFAFYLKKHKFVLTEDDNTTLQSLSPQTVNSGISLFNTTIGPIEKRYMFFSNRNMRRVKSTGNPKKKIGEFNLFIKEQWASRKDELSALCKDGKGSSSVMKKLALEWKNRKIAKPM
jgi:hypothetical protein